MPRTRTALRGRGQRAGRWPARRARRSSATRPASLTKTPIRRPRPAAAPSSGSGVRRVGRAGARSTPPAGAPGRAAARASASAVTRVHAGHAPQPARRSCVGRRWSPAAADCRCVRTYRSAGSTLSSQRATPLAKARHHDVSATDSARLATTPATAALAVWRWWRARCTASSTSAAARGRAAATAAPAPPPAPVPRRRTAARPPTA